MTTTYIILNIIWAIISISFTAFYFYVLINIIDDKKNNISSK